MAQFRSNNRDLVALARNDLDQFWSAMNTDGNPELVRNALLDFFPELVTVYGDAAAALAADFYDELRQVPPSAARFRALLAEPVETEQARASARWALGPLFQSAPDPVQTLANLSGATQRLVLQPGRSTIVTSAGRDAVRTGFARIPQGKTCRFCTMVASRGFVYATAESAGANNRWHDGCDCVVIPGYSAGDLPEGHDLEDLRRLYAEGSGIGQA